MLDDNVAPLHLPGEDSALVPNQGTPHIPFVDELLTSAAGKDREGNPILVLKDLVAYKSKRRVDAKASNSAFTLDILHKLIGSVKWGQPFISLEASWQFLFFQLSSATMLTTFGGRVNDLECFLIKEKLPDGWESRVRSRWGLTFSKLGLTVLPLEFSISEKKYRAKQALVQQPETSQEALNASQPWNILYYH
jgi:hypothetical protein